MLNIHMKKNINFWPTNEKVPALKQFNDSKAFTEYSNDLDDIYKNIKEYNPNKKGKILIAFDDVVGDMFSNKKT